MATRRSTRPLSDSVGQYYSRTLVRPMPMPMPLPSPTKMKAHTSSVEVAVVRLLIAMKKLLTYMNLWSHGSVSEQQVSDVFVMTGVDFKTVIAEFSRHGVDTSVLQSIPTELRSILETCLEEDASPANVDLYLPAVKQTMSNLFRGLRQMENQYRKITHQYHFSIDQCAADSERSPYF